MFSRLGYFLEYLQRDKKGLGPRAVPENVLGRYVPPWSINLALDLILERILFSFKMYPVFLKKGRLLIRRSGNLASFNSLFWKLFLCYFVTVLSWPTYCACVRYRFLDLFTSRLLIATREQDEPQTANYIKDPRK